LRLFGEGHLPTQAELRLYSDEVHQLVSRWENYQHATAPTECLELATLCSDLNLQDNVMDEDVSGNEE
jgi:hypothetical protein